MATDDNNVHLSNGGVIEKSASPIKDALNKHIGEWYEKDSNTNTGDNAVNRDSKLRHGED